MADELHLPLDADARERLAAAAAAHGVSPEEYARHLIEEGIDGRFTRALEALRMTLPDLAAAEPTGPARPLAELGVDELPMSSRDLRREDRNAA